MPSVACTTWPVAAWPLSRVMPPLAALPTAPGCARADVRAVLAAWNMASLTDTAELVVTELVTNAVRASVQLGSSLPHLGGRTPVVRIRLLTDGTQLRVEVWDQANGFPVLRQVPGYAESGRGLTLVDAMTEGCWGWLPGPHGQPGKCVWAEMRLLSP
jgi:anti-sigma regulatory factor (Ser/Thr protein kinase)